MKNLEITIANLKCSGCENTIKTKLGALVGVENVTINSELDQVVVMCSDDVERTVITNKLHDLGYPEATEENGLLLKIKSYASCAIGKMTK